MKLKRILKWSARVILVALVLGFLVVFIAYWRSTNDCDRKTALVNPMKAIRFCEYGSPDVLKFEDVEKPVPNDNQILIKVRAASLNFIDPGLMRGPWPLRLMTGLRKPERTRSIGADHVIDYTKEDFTKGDQRYDLIFDNVNNHSFSDRRRVLTPNGICVLAGIGGAGLHRGMLGRVVGILRADLLSRFVRQKFVRYGTKTDKEDLKLLSDLMRT